MPRASRRIFARRLVVLMIALALVTTGLFAFYNNFDSGVVKFKAIQFASGSSSNSSLTMVGADHVSFKTDSLYANLSSQGLKWAREDIAEGTYANAQNANLVGMDKAGISILGVLSGYTLNGTPYAGKDIRNLTTSQWYQVVYNATFLTPYIHTWEFLNEPQGYGSWTPKQYFTYLVPTYEALQAANSSNVLIGPTETMWTFGYVYNDYGYTEHCGPNIVCDGIGWFKVLWNMSDSTTGLTPAKMLNYVSIHMYTQGYLLNDTLPSGPYAGQTVATMLSAGLHAYYNVTGDSKDFIVDEFGYPSSWNGTFSQTSASTANQTAFYQQVMPFFESKSYVIGVFAYQLKDSSGDKFLWGLFNSQEQAKPAWTVYESYFPDPQSTTTTTSSSSSSSSSFNSTSTPSTTTITTTITTTVTSPTTTKTTTTITTTIKNTTTVPTSTTETTTVTSTSPTTLTSSTTQTVTSTVTSTRTQTSTVTSTNTQPGTTSITTVTTSIPPSTTTSMVSGPTSTITTTNSNTTTIVENVTRTLTFDNGTTKTVTTTTTPNQPNSTLNSTSQTSGSTALSGSTGVTSPAGGSSGLLGLDQKKTNAVTYGSSTSVAIIGLGLLVILTKLRKHVVNYDGGWRW